MTEHDPLWEIFIAHHPEHASADQNSMYPEEYAAWRHFVLEEMPALKAAAPSSSRPDPGYWTRRGPIDGGPDEQKRREADRLIAQLDIRHPEESLIQYRLRTGRRPSPESEEQRRQLFRNCPDPKFVE